MNYSLNVPVDYRDRKRSSLIDIINAKVPFSECKIFNFLESVFTNLWVGLRRKTEQFFQKKHV